MSNGGIEVIEDSRALCDRLMEGARVDGKHWVSCQLSGVLHYKLRAAQPLTPHEVRRRNPRLDEDGVEILVKISQQETFYVWVEITSIELVEYGSTLRDACRIEGPTPYEAPSRISLKDIDCHLTLGMWRCCSRDAKEVFANQVDAW